tara:strand:+ start:521 stop:1177 length:657 start_codon:yes stop_codon:yes gene_type:complete
MKIYNYDRETKEFLNESKASINPLEKGKFLIPSNATDIKPLIIKDKFAICFNEKLKKWEYIEDNRNKTVYDITSKVESKINYLGVLEDGFTLLKPKEFDKWKVSKWVKDVEIIRDKKLQFIKLMSKIEKNIEYNGVSYYGGVASGNLIFGAVTLAKNLLEENITITSVDDNENKLSVDETMELVNLIFIDCRTRFLKYKKLKNIIKIATIKELELLEG